MARVLLVDDDDAVRRDYAKVLKRLGYEVETAAEGAIALTMVAQGEFDVIVSDVNMPGMTGLEFLRSVRERNLDIPVILMTGLPDVETAMKAVEYGVFRFFTKPVSIDTWTDALQRAVSLHALAKLKRDSLAVTGAQGMQLGDRASLDARFSMGLEKIWMAFQPIVRWQDRSVFAYEALVRCDEPSLRSPMDLLDAAERLNRLDELGRKIRQKIAESVVDAPDSAAIFVNLHAADLNDPELFSRHCPLSAVSHRVVLEITERASLDGVTGLGNKVTQLRELGYRIAIDDLGAGYAGLSSFAQLEPDFVKLDMSLVRGVDTAPKKLSVVRAISDLCANELKIQVVAEGVETPAERDVLARERCDFLQGYLFAKPVRGFVSPNWDPIS
jgi:EAL domain-containing protein (putative c-di-GMP-specific phosphodiesterase class I)